MTTAEKIVSDFHKDVVFYTHHVTGEGMVNITSTFPRPSIQKFTVMEAAKRILNFKRMNHAIRKANLA